MSVEINIIAENINYNNLTFVDGLNLEMLKIKYYWVLNAKVKDAIIGEDSNGLVFYEGYFEGIWKSGTFLSGELIGVFESGIINTIKYDLNVLDNEGNYVIISKDVNLSKFSGIFNSGTFINGIINDSEIYSIDFRNGIINNSNLRNGIILNSVSYNVDFSSSTIYNGVYDDCNMDVCKFNGGNYNTGVFTNGVVDQISNVIKTNIGLHTFDDNIVHTYIADTIINNGNFFSGYVDNTINHNMLVLDFVEVYNITFNSGFIKQCNWYNGVFNNGYFGSINNYLVDIDVRSIVVNDRIGIDSDDYVCNDRVEIVDNKLQITKDKVDDTLYQKTNIKRAFLSNVYNVSDIVDKNIRVYFNIKEVDKYYIDTKVSLIVYLSSSLNGSFQYNPYTVAIEDNIKSDTIIDINIVFNDIKQGSTTTYKYLYAAIQIEGLGYVELNSNRIELYSIENDIETYVNNIREFNYSNFYIGQTGYIYPYLYSDNILQIKTNLSLGNFKKHLNVEIPLRNDIFQNVTAVEVCFDISCDSISQYETDGFKIYDYYYEITNIFLLNIETLVRYNSYNSEIGLKNGRLCFLSDFDNTINFTSLLLSFDISSRINVESKITISNVEYKMYENRNVKNVFSNGYFKNGVMMNTIFRNGYYEKGIAKNVVFENIKYDTNEYTLIAEQTI